MAFLRPALLALGLMAIPILLLYILRLRRQEVVVSSTMLWQQLLRDREANAPWQRLRRNLLLFLQLLLLAALVLALARPFVPVSSVVSGNVVVLLDGSASMLAEDVAPNRFALAQAEVERMISDLSGRDQMTLILVAATPRVLVSAATDRSQLRAALAEAQAAPAAADWPSAMALAAGAAQGFREAQIVVVSDGGLPADLPPLPVPVVYLPIGARGDNLAVSALAARPSGAENQLLVGLSNAGQGEQQALVSLRLDGELFDSRRVTVPAAGSTGESWTLPAGAQVIEATLSVDGSDYLAVDNTAWTVAETVSGARALLYGEGNRFLETAFGVLPGIELFFRMPGESGQDPPPGKVNFAILDGVPLDAGPPGTDLLVVGPVAGAGSGDPAGDTLQVTGSFTQTAITRVVDDPLLQFVDWGNVNIRQASRVEAPWARTLVAAEGGPLLLAGEQDGRRIVILAFRLQDSDLPLQIAFPVLVANITNWLSPGRAIDGPINVSPGDAVRIRASGEATAVTILGPEGQAWRQEVGAGPVTFAETGQPGVYQVRIENLAGEAEAGQFAVNLFSPQESTILPAGRLRLGAAAVGQVDQDSVGQREFWPWLAAIGLALLALEWWVYHRGRADFSGRGLLTLVRQIGRRSDGHGLAAR